MDFATEYASAPADVPRHWDRHRKPSEDEVRALAKALKASGLTIPGALTASAAAYRTYVMLAEYGFTVIEIDSV